MGLEEGGRERFPFLALVYLTQPILHHRPDLRGLAGLCRTTTRQEKEVPIEPLGPSLAAIDHLEFKSSESDRSGQAPNCDSLDADEECICEARV